MEGHAHRLLVDRLCREIRILIRREPGGLYVFLGIPLDHPFIGCPLDLIPIPVHGGWTYGNHAAPRGLPPHRYWYGWDYAHQHESDPVTPHLLPPADLWTLERVQSEVDDMLPYFLNVLTISTTLTTPPHTWTSHG